MDLNNLHNYKIGQNIGNINFEKLDSNQIRDKIR